MKVAFFLSKFPVSSETFVLNQINGLIHLGIDVHIFALKKGNLSPADPMVSRNDLLKKTTFLLDESIEVSKFNKLITRLFALSKLALMPRILFKLFQSRYKNSNKGGVLAVVAAKLKQKLKADVVVAHFGPMGVFAQNLQSLGLLDGKVVTVFHGYDISVAKVIEQYREDYSTLFKESAALLPISQLWSSRLEAMGCDKNKLFVNRMGINLNDFQFDISAPSASLTIVTVARLIEKKGLFDAVNAMGMLKQKGIVFSYNIIGDGPLELELENLIREKKLNDCVKLHGFLPQNDVRKALRAADIFLLPSITASNGDMEGIPVALMESMAMGITTVSTYHSGIPELIEHEVSGFLVPERSPNELATTLNDIANGKFDLDSIRRSAFNVISSKFNQDTLYCELKSIIEKVHGN